MMGSKNNAQAMASDITTQKQAGALGVIFQRVARVLSDKYKVTVKPVGGDPAYSNRYSSMASGFGFGKNNGEQIYILAHPLINVSNEYAAVSNGSPMRRMVQLFRGETYSQLAEVLFRPRDDQVALFIRDMFQHSSTMNVRAYLDVLKMSYDLWTDRVMVRKFSRMRYDLMHRYNCLLIKHRSALRNGSEGHVLIGYLLFRHNPFVTRKVRKIGLELLYRSAKSKAGRSMVDSKLRQTIGELDNEFGHWFGRTEVLSQNAQQHWLRICCLLQKLGFSDLPEDDAGGCDQGTSTDPSDIPDDESEPDGESQDGDDADGESEDGDSSGGGQDSDDESDSDGESEEGDPSESTNGGKGDGDSDGDGEADDSDGDEGDSSEGEPGGKGVGKGNGPDDDVSIDDIGDDNGYRSQLAIDDAINDTSDVADADEVTNDQDNDDMEAVNDLVNANKALLPPTGSFTYQQSPVSTMARAAVNKSIRLLQPLQALIDAHWEREEQSGRLNIQTVIQNRGRSLNVFDRWNEGMEDATSMEVVVGVDLSGSMDGRAYIVDENMGRKELHGGIDLDAMASQDSWAIKQTCDQLGARCTVILYDDNFNYGYQPEERIDTNSVRMFNAQGGTTPDPTIIAAHTILSASKARHKLFVILTDGAWGLLCDDALKARDSMVADGVVANVLLYPPMTVGNWGGGYGNYTKGWTSIVEAGEDPMAITTIFAKFAQHAYQNIMKGKV